MSSAARRRQTHWHMRMQFGASAAMAAAIACTAMSATAAPAVASGAACVDKRGQPMATLDLNTATAAQLMQLPRLGAKKADAILALRAKRAFVRTTELTRVKGVGKKTLMRWKPCLSVNSTKAVPSTSDGATAVERAQSPHHDIRRNAGDELRQDVGGPVSVGTGH